LSVHKPGGFVREALTNGNGVAKRLIVALVLFSSVITGVITAAELWLDYRRDVAQIERSLQFIESSYLPTLTDSVWVADREQVQTQIDGLLRLPDLEAIAIRSEGRVRWSAGTMRSQRVQTREFVLRHQHRGQSLEIGRVEVVASIDNVLARLWDRLLTTLVSNAVKTLLVALFMLLAFHHLVTRHLVHLGAFVSGLDPARPQGERIELLRAAGGRWRPDVLDKLAGAINALSTTLHTAVGALRRSDERLSALTRETAAYIYEIDADGRITFANRTYPGLTRAQVEGTRLADWFPPELQPRIQAALHRAFADGQAQTLDYRLNDPAGQPLDFLAGVSPIRVGGAVRSLAWTAVDISRQRAAEEALRELNASLEARVAARTEELGQALRQAEQASRAKSEFLSRMSHELRTPMNAILGFAQIIAMSDPSPRQAAWAGQIRRAGDHLLAMIDDLLDLARIEVGKLSIRLETIDPARAVHEAVDIVQPMIAAQDLHLNVDTADAGPVRADLLRLRQVLVNFLSNAAKYNRPGGTVGVRILAHGDALRIAVTDTGRGIDPGAIERLFSPFERLGAEQGGIAGTGIGLALCRQLADLMHAGIGVDSRVGEGSTFWIDLPRAASAAPVPPSALPEPAVWTSAPADLLYIEDDPANAELVAEFLARHSFVRLRVAHDGATGLALAAAQPPDLVLTDLEMPGLDGFQVLERLRADPRLAGVPVVALSAAALSADRERVAAAGFDRFLSKPLDLQRLLAVLHELLGSAHAAR
jgi:PAS domain S-box-containing protein